MNKVAEHLAQALCSLSRDDKTQVIQYILLDPDIKEAIVELLVDKLSNTKKSPLKIGTVSNKELGMQIRGNYLSELRQKGIPIDQINRVWAKTTSDLWVAMPFATERRLNRWFLGLPESEVSDHLHNRGLVVILLCQSRLDGLLDFVLPSNLVSKIANQLSKSHGQLKFNLKKIGDQYQLVIPDHGTVDVSGYKSELSVLNKTDNKEVALLRSVEIPYTMKKSSRMRLRYNDSGSLKGNTPNGQFLIIHHKQSGPSGFEVMWDGKSYPWFPEGLVEEEFGIKVHLKMSGLQIGHPSEASQRAIWRHFVSRYNRGDPDVEFSG